MDVVLNRRTATVHRRIDGTSSFATPCGAIDHLDTGQLQHTSLERAQTINDASKCGRCFEDGGSY